jgi:hypothetical protein
MSRAVPPTTADEQSCTSNNRKKLPAQNIRRNIDDDTISTD